MPAREPAGKKQFFCDLLFGLSPEGVARVRVSL